MPDVQFEEVDGIRGAAEGMSPWYSNGQFDPSSDQLLYPKGVDVTIDKVVKQEKRDQPGVMEHLLTFTNGKRISITQYRLPHLKSLFGALGADDIKGKKLRIEWGEWADAKGTGTIEGPGFVAAE